MQPRQHGASQVANKARRQLYKRRSPVFGAAYFEPRFAYAEPLGDLRGRQKLILVIARGSGGNGPRALVQMVHFHPCESLLVASALARARGKNQPFLWFCLSGSFSTEGAGNPSPVIRLAWKLIQRVRAPRRGGVFLQEKTKAGKVTLAVARRQ
jgi:hypothetical protein